WLSPLIFLATARAGRNASGRLFEGAAREYGCELSAVVDRRMNVVDGIDLATGLRKFPQSLVVSDMTNQRLFDFLDANGSRPHAAKGDRDAGDAAGAIIGQKGRG